MSRHSPGLETNLGHVPSAGGLAGSGEARGSTPQAQAKASGGWSRLTPAVP